MPPSPLRNHALLPMTKLAFQKTHLSVMHYVMMPHEQFYLNQSRQHSFLLPQVYEKHLCIMQFLNQQPKHLYAHLTKVEDILDQFMAHQAMATLNLFQTKRLLCSK
jgi:hypothetical protein